MFWRTLSVGNIQYSPAHDKRYLQSVGKAPHRPVRHQAEQQTTVIRVPSARSTSGERRRSHVRLDGTGRLCFSAAGPPEYSTQEDPVGAISGDSTSSQLFPPLLSLLIEIPVKLPTRPDLLTQP